MPPAQIIVKRILVSLLISLLIGVAISELTFIFLHQYARPPMVIELDIPLGTAERVARGENSPSLPDSMTFVVGDTLLVKNNDTANHELGPLWIPAGSSANLSLDTVQSYAYACSFQPDKYFGLDVHEPLTLKTRLDGVLFSAIPSWALLALYSLIMPVKKKVLI